MSEQQIRVLIDQGDDNFGDLDASDIAGLLNTIDALRAQLAEARQALSAAKTCIAAKDAAYAIHSRQWNELQEKARTADSEREANAILTDENESLRQQLAEARERLAEIERQEPVGFTHPNAPGGVQFYKPLPALTKLYTDPVSPAAQAVADDVVRMLRRLSLVAKSARRALARASQADQAYDQDYDDLSQAIVDADAMLAAQQPAQGEKE